MLIVAVVLVGIVSLSIPFPLLAQSTGQEPPAGSAIGEGAPASPSETSTASSRQSQDFAAARRKQQAQGVTEAADEKPDKPQPNTPTVGSGQANQKKKSANEAPPPQTKRMFWIVPNFTAVSARTVFTPLSTKEKFKIAAEDSVDYSSFIWAGILAGQSMGLKNYPELGQEASGYARYYWRGFVDQASGAFFSEGAIPALTHEDPRYFTLGEGGFFRRFGYALLQLVVTRNDAGHVTLNLPEILGDACEAGLANAYYPPEERGASKTAVNWAGQMESAGLNNIAKEFWPDIRKKLFHGK